MTDHQIATVGADAPDMDRESTSSHPPEHAPAVVQARMLAISYAVASIIGDARELDVDDVAAWADVARRELERCDTLTSLLDPTAWMRDRMGIAATASVAAAFLDFRRAIEAARA